MLKSLSEIIIYQVVADQAAQNPGAVAILNPSQVALTYLQLEAQITESIDAFKAIGIRRGDRIAVVLPNGAEMAVAFLAIASCATFAPLNPSYLAAEFDFYLSDLNAKALVILAGLDSPVRAIAQARHIPIIELVPLKTEAAGRFKLIGDLQDSLEWELAQPEDVALVLHTSGTTSRPKIVPLTHTNLCTSAASIAKTLELGVSDRCLNIMPLFHIHGLIGVLLSSISAGSSVVCTPGFEASQFFQWFASLEPTWYSAVPTMHQAILAQVDHGLPPSKLRFIRSSSSALPKSVLIALEETFKVPAIEAYGMTEASHQMTSNPLPPAQRKSGSVGRAAGPEVAIMDETGQLLAHGEVGEVVIRGANVTLGYEQNLDANANAFTQSWFRTGDQGSFDSEGYLFLQGRLKEIINRGGEKIVLLEVDAVLMEHPEIFQAVTFAIPHPTLGEDVAAAVVLHPHTHVTASELRTFLFQQLADFKVPSQIAIVDAIPKGATGKLQRIGLADKLMQCLKSDFVPPQNGLEQAIAEIIASVLSIDTVLDIDTLGIHDNFFLLGGDSLRGTQVALRLSCIFEREFPLTLLFRKPTIAELADEILSTVERSTNSHFLSP